MSERPSSRLPRPPGASVDGVRPGGSPALSGFDLATGSFPVLRVAPSLYESGASVSMLQPFTPAAREPSSGVVRAIQLGIVLVVLASWQGLAAALPRVRFFFSQPSAILERLAQWASGAALWSDVGNTLAETLLGFVGGTVLGLLLAFVCYRSRMAERVLLPFCSVANAMPRLVFAPMFMMWFGLGMASKVVLAISLVVFVVFFATFQGLKDVDQNLIYKVRLLGGSERDVTRHVLIPSALSWVFTSLRTGVGFALVGAVVGEYTGASQGVGHRIEFAEGMFDATGVFAGLALLCLMVLGINVLLAQVEGGLGSGGGPFPNARSVRLRRLGAAGAGAALLAWAAWQAWSGSAGAPPEGAARVLKTTLASPSSLMVNLPSTLAEHAGFFRARGLEVKTVDMKSGASAAQALNSGSVDFASLAFDHVFKARSQGIDLVLLCAYTRYPGLSLVVSERRRGQVSTVADLKGMAIGVTSQGSGSHLALNALLLKGGLQPADVRVVATGSGGTPSAIEQGSIDAAMHYDPFTAEMLGRGTAFLLVDLATEKDTHWLYGGDYPFTALVTRREVILGKPEVVAHMVAAVADALRLLQTRDLEAIGRRLPEDFHAQGEVYQKSLRHMLPALSPDGMVTAQQAETVARSLQQTGALPAAGAPIDPGSVMDLSFLRRAQASQR